MTAPTTKAPSAARPAARLHDLGYKPYKGRRRPQSTRWRVIVRSVLSMSWRGWWRLKIWVGGAVATSIVIAVLMYTLRDKLFQGAVAAGLPITLTDGLLPLSFEIYPWAAFVVTMTTVAGSVSKDLHADAFEFYFSRPVRPIDYVAGKLGGAVLVTGMILFAGPVLLSLVRVGLSKDLDELTQSISVIPKMALTGALASLAFAAVPLAISALTRRARNAVAAWAAFYLLVGPIILAIAAGTRFPELGALNLFWAVSGFAYGLFDIDFLAFRATPPLWACAGSLIFYSFVSVALVLWRVRNAQRSGLGGG